jgi:acetate kinase
MSSNLVLVINCGSSSLKFSLIEPTTGQTELTGLAECLHTADACITFKRQGEKHKQALSQSQDHQDAIDTLVGHIHNLNLSEAIYCIGHRFVHGGEEYSDPVVINDEVYQTVKRLSKLAPLHNPANLVGYDAAKKAFPELKQVAIFDTAFHQSIPEKAFLYGLPYQLYKEQGIRRYGFHGSSHYFVSRRAAELLNIDINQCSVISAHLGNGCSVAAIENGKSSDTSMGLTPLEGLIMGTRCGDVDPGLVFHLTEQLNYSLSDVNKLFNKESGLLGLSELSNDCRTIEEAIEQGNEQAALALEVFCYRIARYIGSLTAAVSHLDALIFTGGIGENSDIVREKVLANLGLFDFNLDSKRNLEMRFGKEGQITSDNGRKCLVIPTNEEWVIAQQSYQLVTK